MAKELLARALKEPRWGELQQGPAISALLSLGTNTALGPGANIAPRALAGTCQEHPAGFPNIALHTQRWRELLGVRGWPCSPPPAALLDLNPPPAKRSVLRNKYLAAAAQSDGGDMLIPQRPHVLDEVNITKCSPVQYAVKRGEGCVPSAQPCGPDQQGWGDPRNL